MTRLGLAKGLGRFGSVLLVAGAAFHMTGLPLARAAALEVSSPFLAALLGPLWIVASLHWLVFALVAWLMAGRTAPHARLALLSVGACLLIDAGLIIHALGGFIGAIVLGLCGLLYLSAAAVARESELA